MMRHFLFGLDRALAGFFAACLFPVVGAQEGPRFSGIEVLSNREIRLTLEGIRGEGYRVETSDDLLLWTPWLTKLSVGTDQHLDGRVAFGSSRYYRLIPLGNADVFEGDHLETDAGELVIHPINHASFVMRWNGNWIYSDPVGGSAAYRGIPPADLILVTHSHGDHFNASTLNAIKSVDGVIVAPQAVYSGLPTALRSSAQILANGESMDALGITIEAVPAYNGNHPKGSGNGYVLTIGGKRIYVSGDTGPVAEMRALQNIDIAFLCMNIPYTMTISEAASVVQSFRPLVVYPYHYRNQDSTYANLEQFKEMVGKEAATEVRVRKWY